MIERRCWVCRAVIEPGDDAELCTKCGGMNHRLFPAYCCPWCGAEVGYVGRAAAWLFGTRIHGCGERRARDQSASRGAE